MWHRAENKQCGDVSTKPLEDRPLTLATLDHSDLRLKILWNKVTLATLDSSDPRP